MRCLKTSESRLKTLLLKLHAEYYFLSITFTMCYLMVYYAHNPQITYDIIVPKGDGAKWGFFQLDFWRRGLEGGSAYRGFNARVFYGLVFYGGRILCHSQQTQIIIDK